MRISVNLATRPFVELRPLFARLRIVVVALILLAIGLAFWLHTLTVKARAAEADMNALKAKTLAYQQERQRNEARMHQPQNMAVLERSEFLNALFSEKSFSWTAVMMDLERVLPAGVQVTSIEPATTKTGEVNIRLKVSGERDHAVDLVRNLEKSQRFVAPRLAGESAQAGETGRVSASPVAPGAVEFDILSGYNPLSPAEAKKVEAAAAKDDEDSPAKSDEPRTVSRRARGTKAAPPSQRPMTGGVR
ncbi:PilN domain-containing protein [Edaphobacter aggregans]|uniref:PilN domain-containing protein n=1 Tax=Edaphobacter aggregans TaxID=570835 RepID=UPI00055043DF|nr:PilN domain-containing protein [Edaphobacter aggregans]